MKQIFDTLCAREEEPTAAMMLSWPLPGIALCCWRISLDP